MEEQELSLEDGCCICAVLPVEIAFGYAWCADHYERVAFLYWGHAHRYPALLCTGEEMKYAIAAGEYHWMIVALLGTDDYILAAFRTMDYQDSHEVA